MFKYETTIESQSIRGNVLVFQLIKPAATVCKCKSIAEKIKTYKTRSLNSTILYSSGVASSHCNNLEDEIDSSVHLRGVFIL